MRTVSQLSDEGGWEVMGDLFDVLADAIEYCRMLNGGGTVEVVGPKDAWREKWHEGEDQPEKWLYAWDQKTLAWRRIR